jgi:hypothetical protein
MTISFDLSPEIKARLEAQAAARGLTLEAYLEMVLRERSAEAVTSWSSAEEKAKAFETWAHAHPATPPLSDEAIRRTSLVRDAR